MDVNEVEAKLKTIRRHTRLPLGVGFASIVREGAATMARIADAGSCGSAIVKRIEELAGSPDRILTEVPAFLAAPARGDGRCDRFDRTSIRRPRIRAGSTSWSRRASRARPEPNQGYRARGAVEEMSGCRGAVLYSAEIENNQNVCPKCSAPHARRARAGAPGLFLDSTPKDEIGANIAPLDVA